MASSNKLLNNIGSIILLILMCLFSAYNSSLNEFKLTSEIYEYYHNETLQRFENRIKNTKGLIYKDEVTAQRDELLAMIETYQADVTANTNVEFINKFDTTLHDYFSTKTSFKNFQTKMMVNHLMNPDNAYNILKLHTNNNQNLFNSLFDHKVYKNFIKYAEVEPIKNIPYFVNHHAKP